MEPVSYLDWERSFEKSSKNENLESMQTQFNSILRKLALRSNILKSAAILKNHIKILSYKLRPGQIYCIIKESMKKETEIYVDLNKRVLVHKCKELKTCNSLSKKLCSHVIKMLLTILDENVQKGLTIIKLLQMQDFKFYF